MKKPFLILIITLANALIGSCQEGKPPQHMKTEPQDFAKIDTDLQIKNSCSPVDPGLSWRGIIFRAPTKIIFKSSDGPIIIPLCGFYRIPAIADTKTGFVATVKDLHGELIVVANLAEEDPSPDEPRPNDKPLDPKRLEGVAVAGYFNANLAKYIKIPLVSGNYVVQISFAEYKSKEMQIEIVPE